MVPIDCIPLRLQAVIEQVNDFWFTETGIVWLAVLVCNYYPRYNLAGKSNSTFSSKINRFDGIINRQLIYYIPLTNKIL